MPEKLSSDFSCKAKSSKSSTISWLFIPLTLVECEMIIANSALCASLAMRHLISNARSWDNC